jgi:addiction module HigA family antidote
MKKRKLIPLTTPGEILKEEFIDPLNLQDKEVAKALGIPHSRLSEIIHGKRSITVDTAIRLSRFFRTTPEFWLNYQNHYNLQKEQELHSQKFLVIKPFSRRKKLGIKV